MTKNKNWNYSYNVLAWTLLLTTILTNIHGRDGWTYLLLVPAIPFLIVGTYGAYKNKVVSGMPKSLYILWIFGIITLIVELIALLFLAMTFSNNFSN